MTLSARQKQILLLLAEGKLQKEVADIMGVSIKTVEKHLQRAREHSHIHSVAGLLGMAIKEKLITL